MYEVFLVNTAVEEQTIRKNIKKQKFQLSARRGQANVNENDLYWVLLAKCAGPSTNWQATGKLPVVSSFSKNVEQACVIHGCHGKFPRASRSSRMKWQEIFRPLVGFVRISKNNRYNLKRVEIFEFIRTIQLLSRKRSLIPWRPYTY